MVDRMKSRSSKPSPATRRVTLRDIAREVGVSHVTVSLALRNDPSISIARRAQVKKVARALGYRPDPMLASLASYRQGTRPVQFQSVIAWLNRWNEPDGLRRFREFDAYWRGAEAEADRLGYRLEHIPWPADMPARRIEQILNTRNVQGVLIPPCNQDLDWRGVDWTRYSLIRLGMSVSHPEAHIVTTDHFREMQMAIERMLELGYHRIGLVVDSHFDRRLGMPLSASFLAAQQLLRIREIVPPLLFKDSPADAAYPECLRALRQWLRVNRPDAIMTAVVQLPDMLRELGVHVPRDVAIAGTSVTDVPVTAGINQESVEVGRMAVQMLVAQMRVNERGKPRTPCRILVEGRWQDGASMPPRRRARLTV